MQFIPSFFVSQTNKRKLRVNNFFLNLFSKEKNLLELRNIQCLISSVSFWRNQRVKRTSWGNASEYMKDIQFKPWQKCKDMVIANMYTMCSSSKYPYNVIYHIHNIVVKPVSYSWTLMFDMKQLNRATSL